MSKSGSDGLAGRGRLEMNSCAPSVPCPEDFEAKDSLLSSKDFRSHGIYKLKPVFCVRLDNNAVAGAF